jgi:hypothetical protein
MLQPEEFLQAAREELGDERVNTILHINKMAALRLAEYETAMASGDDDAAAVGGAEGASAPPSLSPAEVAAENES